jgi:CO/xanthine dehydrogenase FAD-binding subunit
VLAGGQSLVPLLNLRLARPELVVDINGIAGLDYLRVDDGPLRIGALTRQAALERSDLVRRRWPLLHKAVRFVGHHQIRSRGTVGGSVAHADPAAELPAALIALRARLHLRSSSGTRAVEVSDFFLGPLHTAREPDELLVEIEVPEQPEGAGSGFAEYARTHGDFATAGAAAMAAPGGHAGIALVGAGPVPVRAGAAERALAGGAGPREAAALAAEGVEDEHRRALCTELARRAIVEALA